MYLEKVGQYLKDEDLKQAHDLANNIWNQLLSKFLLQFVCLSVRQSENRHLTLQTISGTNYSVSCVVSSEATL